MSLAQQVMVQRERVMHQPRHFRQNSARFSTRPLRPDIVAANSHAIQETFATLQPPAEDSSVRQALLERLQALVAQVEPGARLHPFGSSVSGLASKGADLDLTLMMGGDDEMPKEEQSALVEKLAEAMEQSGQMESVHARPKARVPIVALKDATTSLKCDICMCNKLALRNSQLLRAYMSLDPRARQLGFIIKYWAKRRAINDPYRGSPSSYAWVLLVIHYLQTTSPPVLPVLQELHSPSVSTTNTFVRAHDGRAFDCYFFHEVEEAREAMVMAGARNVESMGELLVGFFRRYAREFDFVKSVTSTRTGTFMTKQEKGWDKKEAGFHGDRHLFCIEDPFELTHDLGRVMDRDTLRDVRSEIDRADTLLSEQRGTFEALTARYVDNSSKASKASKPKPKEAQPSPAPNPAGGA